jgi:hypothetical protein
MKVSAKRQQEAAMSGKDEVREQRLRERAYFIWLEEGRPEGRSEVHWKLACMLDPEGKAEVHWRVDCAPNTEREAYVDEEGEGSFPASDPPSHTPMTGDRRRAA